MVKVRKYLEKALLEKEIFSWDQKDLSFIVAITRGVGPDFEVEDSLIAKSLVEQYKHLGIFADNLRLNQRGIKIIHFLQGK